MSDFWDSIKKNLSKEYIDEYTWINIGQGESAQIDMVIERDDKITNICEIKCTEKPFIMTKEYDEELLRKREVFKNATGTKNAIKIIMISASGISGVAHTEHISGVITMDDLFDNS